MQELQFSASCQRYSEVMREENELANLAMLANDRHVPSNAYIIPAPTLALIAHSRLISQSICKSRRVDSTPTRIVRGPDFFYSYSVGGDLFRNNFQNQLQDNEVRVVTDSKFIDECLLSA